MVARGDISVSAGAGARAVARCDELGTVRYSDSQDGLYRAYLTPAYGQSQSTLRDWMVQAGMTVRLDAAANLIGRYEALVPDAPALLIGSHLDSVRNAGRYDGPLGIMLGIECVAALHSAGQRMPFAIEVIAFGDEEGSRFPASMLTTRAVAGTLDPAEAEIADERGIALIDALRAFDPNLATTDMVSARRPSESVIGYLEAHIEQGPVLEAEGLALGVVTHIAAQLRFAVTIVGSAGHAGTSAMHLRRDALAGAAEAVLAVEKAANDSGGAVVATVGRMTVLPGAVNVVPGRVELSIDVRSGEPLLRNAVAKRVTDEIAALCDRRGLEVDIRQVQDLAGSPCDPALTDLLTEAMVGCGHPRRKMVSGAGHDAMVMSALCPTAMLFLRCKGGISHNPAESVTAADSQAACEVMIGFIERLRERLGG